MQIPLKSTRTSGNSCGRAMGAANSTSAQIIADDVYTRNTEPRDSGSVALSGEHPAGALGNTTSNVSGDWQERRYRLQDAASELLPGARVSWCGKMLVSGAKHVDICTTAEHRAYYRNLASCGSVWVCPICASKIAGERREELARALAGWSGSVVMLTLTLQHERDDSLAELLFALKEVWRRMKSGRYWQAIKQEYQIAAYVTATELTWGAGAGWHPHMHILLFSRLPEHRFDRARFKNALVSRYTTLLSLYSRYASDYYGINVRLGDERAGNYVSKFGLDWEISHAITKRGSGGLSPFELLERYADGAGWAGMLFKEYASVFSGHKQLTYSHGARAVLGLDEERADEEIAGEDESGGDVLLSLTLSQFGEVVRAGKRAELLKIAGSGDAWGTWQYLQDEIGLKPEPWQADIFMPLMQ